MMRPAHFYDPLTLWAIINLDCLNTTYSSSHVSFYLGFIAQIMNCPKTSVGHI